MLRGSISLALLLALIIVTVEVVYAAGGAQVPSPPVYSWPPHFSTRHAEVRKLLRQYHDLPAAERWTFHSRAVFNVCLPFVMESSAGDEKEEFLLLKLLGRPRKITKTAIPRSDGTIPLDQAEAMIADFMRTPSDEHPDVEDDELNRRVREHMREKLGSETIDSDGKTAYEKWLEQWRFCEPMLAEWRVAAAYMKRQEDHGSPNIPFWKDQHKEARRCLQMVWDFTPKSVTDALMHLYSGSGDWKEAAFHNEVFHRRLFTKPVEAILMESEYVKRELLAKLVFKPKQPLLTNAKAKTLVDDAFTSMHTLLDHCYGTVVGESYVEDKFRKTAIPLATRYARLQESWKEEIRSQFPVVSSVLLNDGGNCSRLMYNRLFEADDYFYEMGRTKPAIVCHLFRKFALFATFADIVDDTADSGKSAEKKAKSEL